jgi:hypothetical protein
MEQVEKARKVLKSYGIVNEPLVYDIAILMVEAQQQVIKAQLNESENK